MKLLMSMAAKYGGSITEEAAEIIARHSEGSVRDAVRDLNTCFEGAVEVTAEDAKELLGISGWDEIFGILDAVRRTDRLDILTRVGEYIDKGKRIRALFGDMMTALADHLVYLCGATSEWSSGYRELQTSFGAGEEECLALYRSISEAYDKIRYQDDRNSVMVFLIGAAKHASEDYGARIARLEAEIEQLRKGVRVCDAPETSEHAKNVVKECAAETPVPEPEPETVKETGEKAEAEVKMPSDMFSLFDDDMAFMSASESGTGESPEQPEGEKAPGQPEKTKPQDDMLPETNWDSIMADAAAFGDEMEIPDGFIDAKGIETPFEKPVAEPEPVCEVKEPEAKVENLHAGKSFTDLSELVATVKSSNYQKFREALEDDGMLAAMIRNCNISSKDNGSVVVVEIPADTSALTRNLITGMLSGYKYVKIV